MMKRQSIILIGLAVLLATTAIILSESETSDAEPVSLTVGGVTWEIDENVLHISGSGTIYGNDWYDYRESITNLVIEGDISFGPGCFSGLTNVTELTIPIDLHPTYQSSFQGLVNIQKVTITAGSGVGYDYSDYDEN